MPEHAPRNLGGLSHARVLVAVGELARAEAEVEAVLDADPDHLDALRLLAKIKHIRGALTEAVACWAHTHGRSRHQPLARMHLLAMLDLTRDPERGAGEFMAVGHFQLARKPLAYLELDEAYRLFLARRPDEARAHCQRVAIKHYGRDRELFKLAVLADALFAELSGEIVEAARTLERFGSERGFEGDLDRVLVLMELYERIGAPAELRAALNIGQYLERTYPGIPILGRVALLYRRLGEPQLAERYEDLHRAAFEESMHRVSSEDAMSVAASRYVPLAWLARGRWPERELGPSASVLERVIWEAVHGGRPARLMDLPPSAWVVERKYATELALREGAAGAAALAAGVLHEDEADASFLEVLFGHASPPSWTSELLAGRSELAASAERALRAEVERDARNHRAWRALARVAAHRGLRAEKRAAMLARASALEVTAGWRSGAVGRVLAAAVYRFVGKTKGLIHEIWVAREPVASGRGGTLRRDAILGNVTEEMKGAVLATFVAVREHARATFPHLTRDLDDYDYSFRITKDDEPSSGTSAGLPTALAFLSVFLQRPVPQDLAFTGVVVADAHDVLVLRRIGDAEHKVKGAFHRDLRGLVLPEENREELSQSAIVPAAVRDAICLYATRFEDAARLAFGDADL